MKARWTLNFSFSTTAQQAQFTRLDGRTLHSSNACMLFFRHLQNIYICVFQEHYVLKDFWEKSWVYRTFLMFDVVTKSMIDVGDIAWDPLKGRKTKKRKYVEGPDSPNLFSLSFHIFPKSVFTQNFWVIFKNSYDLFWDEMTDDTGLSNEVFNVY